MNTTGYLSERFSNKLLSRVEMYLDFIQLKAQDWHKAGSGGYREGMRPLI